MWNVQEFWSLVSHLWNSETLHNVSESRQEDVSRTVVGSLGGSLRSVMLTRFHFAYLPFATFIKMTQLFCQLVTC